ncbi:urease accessory protein UreF [Corynebacterium callunae]|uniref:urease accessory protein UreF n=1 Tax=Corynebacterium callunae TaxID=1721 RepID=UPI003981FD1F
MQSTPTNSLQRTLAAMQLMDSALPTGAFSHSFGFETYMHRGDITNAESFARWLEVFCREQLTFTDAVIVREVFEAENFAEIIALDHLVRAQAVPGQVRHAGRTMGVRMLEIASEGYSSQWLSEYQVCVEKHLAVGHPALVWALVARDLGFEVAEAVAQHLYATVISLIQNAVRAVPIGQNAGQRLATQAQEWVSEAVETSAELGLEDLGAITPGLEIAQMQHENQRVRMFMS